MTRNHILPILFFAFIIAFSFSSCKLGPVVPTGVEDVKFGNLDMLKGIVDLDMGLKISNPNPVSVTVHSLDLNVAIAGIPMGKVLLTEKFKIKKHSDDVHRVKVHAEIKDLITSLPKILAAIRNKQTDVTVTGSIRVGSGLIRHTFPIDLKQDKVKAGQ